MAKNVLKPAIISVDHVLMAVLCFVYALRMVCLSMCSSLKGVLCQLSCMNKQDFVWVCVCLKAQRPAWIDAHASALIGCFMGFYGDVMTAQGVVLL